MPELPDIYVLAESMNKGLLGRKITDVIVNQPKCLNMTPRKLKNQLVDRVIGGSSQRGKWIITELDQGLVLANNLGMGGEIRLFGDKVEPDPKKHRVVFVLDEGEWIGIHHWWFGHVHVLEGSKLASHPQISKLGIEPLTKEFTVDKLRQMLEKKRGRIKSYLLDQSFIAGIGNVYVQDILWHAGLHPDRKSNSLSTTEIEGLHKAIQKVLKEGIKYKGGPGEQDLFGKQGTYMKHRAIGYKTGEPCPECGTNIEELRVGQTTSYICPKCQSL